MDSLIGTGDTYFNSLGQERTEVTFVEMEDGPVLRKGKKVHLCARRWHRLRPWMQGRWRKGTASGRKTGGLDYSQICR